MSQDAKNSILLWIGTVIFIGLVWSADYFEIDTNVPDQWLWPMVGIAIGVNVTKFAWNRVRRRRTNVS